MPAGSKQAGVRGEVPDTPKGTSVSLSIIYTCTIVVDP